MCEYIMVGVKEVFSRGVYYDVVLVYEGRVYKFFVDR